MSVSINLTGGGSGFSTNDALVRVIAPSGSSVSVTAGGSSKTLSPLSIVGDAGNGCYYDIVKPGSFSSSARSYSATLGYDSASTSLVVNASGEYTRTLSFWDGTLYNAGDEQTSRTGGFETFIPAFDYAYNVPGATKNAANLTIYASSVPTDQWYNGAFGTVNAIDLSGFTTLHIQATAASVSSSYSRYAVFGVQQGSKHIQSDSTGAITSTATEPNKTISVGETTLDISALDSGYVWFGVSARNSSQGSGSYNVVVTKIWLT